MKSIRIQISTDYEYTYQRIRLSSSTKCHMVILDAAS